jgi:hypothetical protein
MAMRWRTIALIGLWVTTWIGCSDDGGKKSAPEAVGGAGQSVAGQDSRAGDSASAGTGGVGGRSSSGGMFGTGAIAGAAGDAGAASGGTAAGVPAGWSCIYFAYADGKCDCGCGVVDADCKGQALEQCEVCNTVGGCNVAECPGRIDPDDVTQCITVPAGWTCDASRYRDGKSCDCGCGVQDKDCPNTDVASCDDCAAVGSCANGPCPSALAVDDNTRCAIPPRWTCDASLYGDGTCNCGCGVVDVDCRDATLASCELCDVPGGCSSVGCAVEPENNAQCPKPPVSWNCSARLYHDGTQCDCGCGAIDPDCESLDAGACEKCDAPGSCSAQPCPGLVNALFNGRCDQPDPPAGWTCVAGAYGDGIACDCGCGIPDPDCRNDDINSCVRCFVCGGHGVCAGTLDPLDSTQCAPPPPEWTCSADAFRDSVCDCGCGLLDSFCQDIELRYVCGNFPVEGCSAGHRAHIDPNHNPSCIINVPTDWTCDRTYYFDGLCDCGCGAFDLDCQSNSVTSCDKCDDVGSCSSAACPGTILANNATHCSN